MTTCAPSRDYCRKQVSEYRARMLNAQAPEIAANAERLMERWLDMLHEQMTPAELAVWDSYADQF